MPEPATDVNTETEAAVYFYTPPFGALDAFSAHRVRIWGQTFPTAEHAYQWKKFADSAPEVAQLIFEAPSPVVAKQIVKAHRAEGNPNWAAEKVNAMRAVSAAKAQQHADVREALRKTGTRTIYENSPTDDFWGRGPDGKGQNMIGEIWMQIRNNLLAEDGQNTA